MAGRDYWRHMRRFMSELGFKACKADPEVWMREHTSPDGESCQEYVLLYVDDCLVISHCGIEILREEIGVHFKLKEESIGEPKLYLGGKIQKRAQQTKDRIKNLWSFLSSQYIQNACKNVKQYLKNETRPGFKVTKKDN